MNLMRFFSLAAISLSLFGCANFDDINTNPDTSTHTTSKLLCTGAIAGILKTSTGAGFVDHMFPVKYIAWGEGARGSQYNDFYRTSFDGYVNLLDYKLMAELAPEKDKNAYEGMALFLKAYKMFDFTMSVGDVPYTEILKGDEGILTPKYDTQKDVFLFILKDLDDAYSKMSQAETFEGDFVFNGDPKKWCKVISVFQMRVLINLSLKTSDEDLDVVRRFNDILSNRLLMESNEDNLQLTYSDKSGQLYPYHESYNKHWAYAMVSDYIIDLLKKNNDYRLFYYARPAGTKLDEDVSPSSFDAYIGVDPTAPIAEIRDAYATNNYSGLNYRYIYYTSGEPFVRIGYIEQNFILAEASLRGWINGNSNDYLKEAVKASFRFITENTPDNEEYHNGNMITDSVVEEFLSSKNLQMTGDFEHDLNLIMEQKYIAGFMQTPWNPYYDYRRTGLPKLPINPETSLNFNAPDKIPVRWQYPDSEFSYNRENVEEAIQRQYDGADEVNKLMWILKE